MSEYLDRATKNLELIRGKAAKLQFDSSDSYLLEKKIREIIRDLYRQISLTEEYPVITSNDYIPDFRGLNNRLNMRIKSKMLHDLTNLFDQNYILRLDTPELYKACKHLRLIAVESYARSKIYQILDREEASDRSLSYLNKATTVYAEDQTYRGLDKGLEYLCLAMLSTTVSKRYFNLCNYNAYRDSTALLRQYLLHSTLPNKFIKFIGEVRVESLFGKASKKATVEHNKLFEELCTMVKYCCGIDLKRAV